MGMDVSEQADRVALIMTLLLATTGGSNMMCPSTVSISTPCGTA
jgi:hypothetical protein